MRGSTKWPRPLVWAAALTVTVGIAVADAQTVIVRHAPAQSTVELVLNADTVGSATAAPGENVTLSMDIQAKVGKPETSAHVFVDACTNLGRVLFVEAGLAPPAQGAGCDRKQIAGLYAVRGKTTFVIDVGGVEPAMWLTQGPAPPSWLGDSSGVARGRDWDSPPVNLVLFGGGSLARFSDASTSACGSVTTCSGKDVALSYRVGAAYWMKPFLAAEVSYMKPRRVTGDGSGDGFHFQSVLDTQMVTVAGNVGLPVGRARFYGQGGANYHRATSTTTETIDASGTQTLALTTEGWGWLFGGGADVWITRRFAIYAELGVAHLKGKAINAGQGVMDDHVTFAVVGGRIHVGR